MTDPVIKKISELTELTAPATGDLLVIVDISESIAANRTKKMQASNVKLFNSAQITDGIVVNSKIANSAITTEKIADGAVTDAKLAAKQRHVVYVQLFLTGEAIVTTTARTQFFVPGYLAGGVVKQLGMGIVTPATGKTVTVKLGTSYGSVSGTSSTETVDTLSYTLPAALTKIPIDVTCSTGDPAPKGLDFWFVVLK